IFFSARVKTYTIDILLMLGLALVVAALAKRRWDARIAALWVGIAVVVATVSAIGPLLTTAAGAIFVLHPRQDRRCRVVAFAAQLAAHAIYVLAVLATYNQDRVKAAWTRLDAFID